MTENDPAARDTLTGLWRAVRGEMEGMTNAPRAWALAQRIEVFASREPAWDPEGRVNLLTQLARTIDPLAPRDADAALATLRKAATAAPRVSRLTAMLTAPLPTPDPSGKEGLSPGL